MNSRYSMYITDAAACVRLVVVMVGPLLLLLHGGECAPAREALRPVWRSPCGEKSPPSPGTILVPGAPIRHSGGAKRAMKRVRDQLAVALRHISDSQLAVQRLYGNFSGTFSESQYKYDWLPRKQLQWFRKNKQCSADKGAEVLVVFHKSLQNFSVTFEAMKNYGESQIDEEAELYALRDSLVTNITIWHKMLHCETETAIHNMRLPVPEWASTDILTQDKWSFSPDLTQTLMRDWGVISRYGSFLEDWSIVMKLLMRKDPPSCSKAGGNRINPRKNRHKRRRQNTPT